MSGKEPTSEESVKSEPTPEDSGHEDRTHEERARKEKVLHTRIPASLEEEIKRLADALAIPVSNLVRNILQDTVGMVGTVADHVGGVVTGLRDDAKALSNRVVADRDNLRRRWADYQVRQTRAQTDPAPEASGEAVPPAKPAAPPPLDGIFGWQPLTLNIETTCALCALELARGAEAFLGLGDDPKRRIFICPGCLPRA
ncbi:MAG: hypothetical protein HY906_12860 [Deltaproteobacteria bacterium]|nr:hypothetical protein [Deltaproteobacteria bacterium]